MCACTDRHSARMLPSPKPVAPLRSISSRKKVSSENMGFVNTWRRYLWEGQQPDTHFFDQSRLKRGPSKQSFNKECLVFCWGLNSGYFHLLIKGCLSALLCLLTFSFPQTQKVMRDPGGGQYPEEFHAAPTSGGRVLPLLFPAAYPPVTIQRRLSHNSLNYLIVFGIVICLHKGFVCVFWHMVEIQECKLVFSLWQMKWDEKRRPNLCIVGRRRGEELDAGLSHCLRSGDNILSVQANMLDARSSVLLQESVHLVPACRKFTNTGQMLQWH